MKDIHTGEHVVFSDDNLNSRKTVNTDVRDHDNCKKCDICRNAQNSAF